MSKHSKTSDAKFAWGAKAIGEEIDRTASQIHYMFEQGLLGDAVWKMSHKIMVGDRQKLRDLQALASKN
jgi:hypothetical protein